MKPNDFEIRIRDATPDDASAIARIHIDSFAATYSRYQLTVESARAGISGRVSHWRTALSSPTMRTLVAVTGDRAAGFVTTEPSPDRDHHQETVGHIRSIHVDPQMSRSGVGSLLMAAAEEDLRDRRFVEATLWVVSDNAGALEFYSRLGWEPDGNQRVEKLAVGDEGGDLVEVVRLRKHLGRWSDDYE